MDRIQAALDIISHAEAQLSELVQDAARARAYEEIARLAEIANSLAMLKANDSPLGLAERSATSAGSSGSSETRSSVRVSPAKRADDSAYPRFERENDRLIKVGWSSKEKSEYEHKVTRTIVDQICRHLLTKSSGKKPFKMDKLFPLKLEDGDVVPPYQGYLVLKWLLQHQIIERRGNDGYVLVDRSFGEDSISTIWERTPVRG